MQLTKIFIIFLILLSTSSVAFGQDYLEDENWLKGFYTEADSWTPLLYLPERKFTVEDVENGKKKLSLIRQFTPKNEWEGLYYGNTEIGDERLVWNAEGGFFSFYFYHYLKRFDFGKVFDSPDYIEFIYEKPPILISGKKQITKSRLVRVKFGEQHFLVPENRLRDFCERAVGLGADSQDFFYYWVKYDDMHKDNFGLPILPEKYRHFLRYPIEAEIIRVGEKEIIRNKDSNEKVNFDHIIYTVTLNVGKNKNIKSEMSFWVEDLKQWIQIEKVSHNSSVGFIRRDFGENNREQCWDGINGLTGETVPCKKISVGMKAKTKASGF